MLKKGIEVSNSRILILGLTFKENCPDLRNTKVIDIIQELKDYGIEVDIYGSLGGTRKRRKRYMAYRCSTFLEPHRCDAVVLTVAHEQFSEHGVDYFRGLSKEKIRSLRCQESASSRCSRRRPCNRIVLLLFKST